MLIPEHLTLYLAHLTVLRTGLLVSELPYLDWSWPLETGTRWTCLKDWN
jgi:hypothetical protein